MFNKFKFVLLSIPPLLLFIFLFNYFNNHNVQVFNSKGVIATQEKNLILFALSLSLFVLVPVFMMLIIFSIKYRESNKKSKYSPNYSNSKILEFVWWLIPSVLILILSIVTWNSSHSLDTNRAIVSDKKPVHIQVISMDWKWLFIYPDNQVASLNSFTIPVNTPVVFDITSDAPMNSFWIPQLGGQIYSMPGMSTQLNLEATNIGIYTGRSANISGKGFAGMIFKVNVVKQGQYSVWLDSFKKSNNVLNLDSYKMLSMPSENNPVTEYSFADPGIFDFIMNKYNNPTNNSMNYGMMN